MSEVKSGKYEQNREVRWYKSGLLHREDDLLLSIGMELKNIG